VDWEETVKYLVWMGRAIASAAFACLVTATSGAAAEAPQMVTDSYLIPSGDPGIQLYVRNKHPAGMTHFRADRILLFVHGATYPAETAFDLPLGGVSMMEWLARRGWDVWLVDVRGYGGSTRPPEMDHPAADNPPIVDTAVAAGDVGSAVEHILKKRGVKQINLMGWSWGTSIMGLYTTEHNDHVARLVLYAPQWIASTPSLTDKGEALGAYRSVSRDSAKERWLKGVAEDQKATLIPSGWFEQWADATFATDPVGAAQTPPVLRAPNGIVKDSRAYWRAGKAQYDPGKITVPTLLIHAEWDADLPSDQTRGYFAQLTHTPWKRYVEIGEGTHTVIMEKNRMQLFHGVADFLEEGAPLAMK
jgi:pimeloyl-ACP methyl ester carboxylesterase